MTIRSKLLQTAALTALAGVVAAGPHTASAQQSAQSEFAIEEITVTARKRAESIQDAPIAVTAFSSQDIQAAGFDNILDITKAAPGVFVERYNDTTARINTTPRFRGIFLSTGNPLQQTAGIFIDGAPIVGGIQSIGVQELERVEIIKGPQSALFGRNTFAGAINYVTKEPGDEFKADVAFTAATRDEYLASGSVEGPISDTLKYRLNASYDFNGGHYDNIAVDGQELGETETWSVSGTLIWEPTDKFRAKFRGAYWEDDDGPPAAQHAQGTNTHNFGGFPIDPVTGNADTSAPFDGIGATDGSTTESVFAGIIQRPPLDTIGLNGGQAEIDKFVNLLFADPRYVPGRFPSFDVTENDRFGLRREALRLATELSYDITDDITFTVQGNYNKDDTGNWFDFDQSEDASFLSFVSRSIEDYNVEVRLTGQSFEDKLTWKIGGNLIDIDIESLGGTMNDFGGDFFFSGVFGDVAVTGAKTLAVFGSLDYQLTEELSIIFEGRYQGDEISEEAVNAGLPQPISPATLNKFLPRVIVNYEPTDDTLIYANWSVGNLPGGFNPDIGELSASQLAELSALAPGASVTFGEEKLQNYELGWKQSALDGRLAANTAIFYMRRSDEIFRSIEVVTADPGDPNPTRTVAFNANGATTDIKGIEIDLAFNATERISLGGSFAYTDSKIDSFPEGEGSGDFGDIFGPQASVQGQRAPRWPKLQGSFNATYTHPLAEGGYFDTWFTRVDAFYTGSYFSSNANVAETDPSLDVNLRTGVGNDRLRFELFVTNLFDEDNPASVFNFADVTFQTRTIPGNFFNFGREGNTIGLRDRRQFGARVNYSF